MDEQRMKEEWKPRQIKEEKKKVFRIPKKPRPPEHITEQTHKSAKLSAQEKLEKAKKLAANFGNAKTVVSSPKSDSNRSSTVSDNSSSKHKHDKPSHSEQRKTGNDKHSNNKNVPKQSHKKSSYKDKLEKMSDREKPAIIKKISRSLGRVGDKISDTEKRDKIRKISETIRKGSSSNSDMNEKQNGYPACSPLSSKIDRDKMTGNLESLKKIKKEFKEAEERVNGKTFTMLGKTDEGIKREVIFDRTDAETMRYALQNKAARIRAMMNKPEEPKPRERKKDQSRQTVTLRTDNMATSNKRKATDTRWTIKGTKRSKDTNDFDYYSKDFSLKSVQPIPPTSEIVLRIIAKTNMNNGYCYLGFDEEHKRIFRPITNTMAGNCCWPLGKDFCWKKSYRFLVTLHPDEDKVDFLTPYPHCNEDLVVTSIVKEEKTVPFNVEVLISVAKLDINDIFLDIKEENYLFDNNRSPSAGILKCRSRNVSLYLDDNSKKSKFRIHLPSGNYVFSMKGINIDDIPTVDRELLVVLGLGRPYTKKRFFHPARCYILVVGLFVV